MGHYNTRVARPGLDVGDVIGSYRLGPVLGAGGLGTVFATTGPAGEALAIKVMSHGDDPSIERRALREAEALRRLDHPNVLRLVDAGTTGPWSYVVMPRIAGTTLRQVVTATGPLLPESAALVLLHAAHGIGAIHGAGLSHRDIKPDNLMLTDDGRVVIIDLGLALAPDWTRHTSEGAIAGSLPYMAPEQIEGTPGPASDVWALGVTWWEIVTGERPFARERANEEVAAIVSGTRSAITDVDRRIDAAAAAVLERCLSREVARRPADGAALATELAPIAMAGLGGIPPGVALARLRTDRVDYEGEVASRIARACRIEASALAAGGDVFAAVRALDRALAYRPGDPELAAAIDALMPGASTRLPAARGLRHRGSRSRMTTTPEALAPTGVAVEPAKPPRPPRRRRWPWVIAVGVGVAGAGATALAFAMRGGDAPAYDLSQPSEVAQVVLDAAKTGDATLLPSLCLEGEGEPAVHAICGLTPGSDKWATFRAMFAEASVSGALRNELGALVRYDHPREPGRFVLLRRHGRYYLQDLQ